MNWLARIVLCAMLVCAAIGVAWVLHFNAKVYARAPTGSGAVLTTIESRTVSVRINRPFAEVYEFLVRPENWNQWATGLGKSIKKTQEEWIAETAQGQIRVRFTPRNDFGVVDHYVVRKTGPEIYVPMRLVKNDKGCELLFTLFREPGMNDERYAGDLEFVKRDLNGLKDVLEKRQQLK